MKIDAHSNVIDSEYERYTAFCDKAERGCWIFGAGTIGRRIMRVLEKFPIFAISGFIDNDTHKVGGYIGNYQILSIKQYQKNFLGDAILIGTQDVAKEKIVEQLENIGLTENIDYCTDIDKLLGIVAYKKNKELYIQLTQICVTERCTLKCKKCAHGCNYVDMRQGDMDIGEVISTTDAFFKIVDFCRDFVFIGGEPLLYKYLDKAIDYVGREYSSKIGRMSITTNGTILPSKTVLEMCKKYDVEFSISNYEMAIPNLEDKYRKLSEILDKYQIEYMMHRDMEWTDYGFGTYRSDADEKELEKIFDECNTICHESRGKRFYFCVMARSVSDNMNLKVGKEDYLDISQLCGDDGKRTFLEYSLGYLEKGYLDMCAYCRGKDRFRYPIPAGEQM